MASKKSKTYQVLINLLRFSFAAAGVAYIVYAINWSNQKMPDGTLKLGVAAMLKQANMRLLIAGFLITGLVYPILSLRWYMLMRTRGLQVSFWNAARLTMVGCFFNYCMPGTTGGDVVKIYYAARGSHRKADAAVSVIVDRVLGLLGLLIVAGVAGLFMHENEVARRITIFIWASGAVVGLGAMAYFSRHVRRLIRLDHWLEKLPGGRSIAQLDMAVIAYRKHKGAVVLGLLMGCCVHTCLVFGAAMGGYALGMDRPIGLLLTVVPILFLSGSLPISYQGLGVMEALGKPLLVAAPMCTMNHLVGMLLLIRLFQMSYSLIGAIFLLKGDIRLHPELEADYQETMHTQDADNTPSQ